MDLVLLCTGANGRSNGVAARGEAGPHARAAASARRSARSVCPACWWPAAKARAARWPCWRRAWKRTVAAPAATPRRTWSTGASARRSTASRSRPTRWSRWPSRSALPSRRCLAEFAELTTFEVGTAFAFLHFAQSALDMAVLEVGVGGRFDATNLVEPLVSVITPISYEHTRDARSDAGGDRRAQGWHPADVAARASVAPQPEGRRVERIERRRARGRRDWRWANDRSAATRSVGRANAYGRAGRPPARQRHDRGGGPARAGWRLRATPIRAGLEHVEWPGPIAGAALGAVAGARWRPQCRLGRGPAAGDRPAFRVRALECWCWV